MKWGEISAGVVVRVVVASQSPGVDWVEVPYGVGIGWAWDGATWTGPDGQPQPVEPTTPGDFILSGPEWVDRFTDDEWAWIKAQRNQDPATNASKALDKMMDAIRRTNSVDVSSPNMDPFYDWLLNNGIPGGQARIDQLRAARS